MQSSQNRSFGGAVLDNIREMAGSEARLIRRSLSQALRRLNLFNLLETGGAALAATMGFSAAAIAAQLISGDTSGSHQPSSGEQRVSTITVKGLSEGTPPNSSRVQEIYYPGAPHGITATHPGQINADLLTFLRKVHEGSRAE